MKTLIANETELGVSSFRDDSAASNSAKRATRVRGLDVARGGAVLAVVFMHASIMPHYANTLPDIYDQLNTLLSGIRMPVLMLIAGYLTSRSRALDNRSWVLLWLFVVWVAIMTTAHGILHQDFSISRYVAEYTNPQSPMWFIAALLFHAQVAKLNLPSRYVLGVTATLTTALYLHVIEIESFSVSHTAQTAFYFYLGLFHGERFITWSLTGYRKLFWMVPALLAVRLFDMWSEEVVGGQLLGLVERVIAIALFIQIADVIARVALLGTALAWFGRNTLPIFAVHAPLLGALHLIDELVALGPWFAVPAISTIAVAAAILIEVTTKALGWNWLWRPVAVRSRAEA